VGSSGIINRVDNISVLTVNTGSSSVKLALFLSDQSGAASERTLELSVINIGQPSATLSIQRHSQAKQTHELETTDHEAAMSVLLEALMENMPSQQLAAIGHRLVHGGPRHSQPELITEKLLEDLQHLAIFDPEHTPAALKIISALTTRFPDIPQVACFDTAFFRDMPREAQIIPIPRKYETQGLRRYGFHGLSYTYLLSAFQEKAGDTAAHGRVIFAHLGSGASLAAVKNGRAVDTTMGFTPASGVPMSTRSGDLDPGVAGYLLKHGMSPDEYNHMINAESGLLGVSELSADMLTLLQNEATNQKAAEAVNLFCYQVRKSIGALSATLGGLDSLVFSGGMGEQSVPIRARICEGLEFLGISIDETENTIHSFTISRAGSQTGVHVLPTDEALFMAREIVQVVDRKND
jgi:acetate kinase